jgi:hypothetical protein
MSVLNQNSTLHITRLSIPLADFPTLLASHVSKYKTTSAMEVLGRRIKRNKFPLADVEFFVKEVCRWGNYAGVSGKMLKHNSLADIQARLVNSSFELDANNPEGAISEITAIKCLGVSFGSKHLKFLNPAKAVVLDSIISERLGYKRNIAGYVEFLDECFSIRNILNKAGIDASPSRKRWRVSDVEMAIFKSIS